MSNNDNKAVALTILAQLGGNKFVAMTGARNLLSEPRALSFRLGRNSRGVKAVAIRLEDDDTYTMRFIGQKRIKVFEIARHEGVYAEDLCRLFEAETGLYTRL